MNTIEINQTLIVLDQVAAIQLPDTLPGGSLQVYLAGSSEPLVIPGAGDAEYLRLKTALETA